MQLQTKTVRQGINKAYLKINVKRADLDRFKEEAIDYLNSLEHADGESEEHLKGYLKDFLQNSFYTQEERLVNTSNRVDLGVYSGKTKSSTLEVLIEAKKPGNTREMITKKDANAKALHEALLYYFEERDSGNEDIKQVIITNYTEFFLFDAQEIERNFYSKKSLVKIFKQWRADKKVSSNTDFMYSKFEEYIKDSDASLNAVHVDLSIFKKKLAAPASEEDDKKLIPLYKLFSPEHLVKKPFANDSNSLDKRFYNELLHILGLQEVKEKGSRLIQRLPKEERQRGSLIENTIEILLYDQHMNKVEEAEVQYGDSKDDQHFGVALELVITWMNRVLFLKLMEAQLLAYHQYDEKFKFLDFGSIDEYDELEKLFFRVLALRNEERPPAIQKRFGHIPYLNSSLFDATKLEDLTTRISGLDDRATLGLYSKSILKKGNNPPKEELKTLDYLLRFLDAYNFSAESSGGIQTEDKTLINASVLGLIFEKINGYKDGSFFTPGFITEYMARETLRKAVADKFWSYLHTESGYPHPDSERAQNRPSARRECIIDIEVNNDRVEEVSWKVPDELIERARELRQDQTAAEEYLWQLLRGKQLLGYKFRRQHPLKEGMILDFYCAKEKLAIEVDGGYHDTPEQKQKDENRTDALKEKQIQVIRFKNEDVLEYPELVLNEIAKYLQSNTSPSTLSGRAAVSSQSDGNRGRVSEDSVAYGGNYLHPDSERAQNRPSARQREREMGQGFKFEDLPGLIGHEISYEKANELVNSITICDPAVGSGHFLVSCLNELIAIKSELKILCDHEGKRIPYLDIEVENDELAIEHEGELFEYKLNHEWKNGKVIRKPAGSDRQRVQVALFHEKKFLIENCLFGVDINPNSVKICRLRLWIELLKHAYYKEQPTSPSTLSGRETVSSQSDGNRGRVSEDDVASGGKHPHPDSEQAQNRPSASQRGRDGYEAYSELEVLPNIDINIKQGNSLVSRFGLDEDLSSIFKKSEHSLEDYKQAVRSYRETRDRSEKQRLQQLIDDIKAEYSESLLNNKPINKKLSKARGKLELMQNEDLFGEGKATKKELKKQEKKVTKLEEQKAEEEAGAFYREAFEWRFEFPEVLDEEGKYEGFDVVIGNPPYVRQEALGDLKPFLKTHFDVYAGTADLYAYFIEQGVKLLRQNGYFHYIVANKWMRANYGKPLRTWMQQRQISAITDFGDLSVFEEATTYPCLLEIKKAYHPTVFKALEVESLPVEDFDVLEEENGFEVDAAKLSEEGWSLVPLQTQRLLEKLKEVGTPMGEYVDGKIYRGLLTGLNKAFVIDGETKNRLIEEDPSSTDLMKPFLAGRDIKRYQVPKTDNYLILVKNGQTNEMRGKKDPWEWFSKTYPAVANYLSQFEEKAKARYDQGEYWWELRACSYYDEFEKPKIMLPDISLRGNFAFDESGGKYLANTAYMIGTDELKLLGILSSRVTDFFYRNISSSYRGGYLRFIYQYLEQIPIPEANEKQDQFLSEKVDQILTAKKENPEADTGQLEAEIDRLVYELYGLSEEEVGIVEGSVG